MSSQPVPENRARLQALAAALAERAPALRLQYRSGPELIGHHGTAFEWVGLAVTTSLMTGAQAQVVPFVKYESGGALPMFELAVYEGQPPVPVIFEHLADPNAVIQAIVDWATGPLRTGAGAPRPAKELEKRARREVAAAIKDAQQPPAIKDPAQLTAADPAVMAFYFPRDQRGRMLSSARVLLEIVGPSPQTGRSHCRFVQLREGAFGGVLSEEFVENQDHRWHTQSWRWQRSPVSPSERWGVDDLDLSRAIVRHLETAGWTAAFGECGVDIGDTLRRVLNAEPLGHLYRDLAAGWATVAAEQLGQSAPWRFAGLATKKPIRLFGLGGMNIQSKPGVYLRLVAGRPTLDMETSASNRRLAREDWERPLDYEAYRLGIEPPVGLPIDWPRLEDKP